MINIKRDDEYDFLFTSYVLDYPRDSYNRKDGDVVGQLEQGVRNIRRRYNNQLDYLRALSLYNEYMFNLMEKHGGKKIFKLKYKNGDIQDYIPHKPRMKNNKKNRQLEKEKIILSDTAKLKLDMSGMKETIETIEDKESPEIIITDNEDKDAEKIIAKGIYIRPQDILKGNDSIDYLEQYFANKRRNLKKEYLNDEDEDRISLKDIMEGNYVEEDENDSDDILFYQGNMMNRRNIKQLSLMEDLNKYGWNSLKIMRHTLSGNKAVTKIMKKRKKKIKKISKKQIKHYDSFMSSVLGDDTSFSDFEEDVLDFTAKNIFK